MKPDTDIPVWDPLVRFIHWSVVLGFVVAYVVEDDLMTVHVWPGYAVGGLVVLRIVWGLIGSRYARFSAFLFPPREVMHHLKELAEFRPQRHIGHSPVGGAMIVVLLVALLGTVISGVWVYASTHESGPLSGVITSDPGGVWDVIHETFSNLTLLAAAVHIIAVLLVSWLQKENLVKAMFTGLKRGPEAGVNRGE